MFVNTFLLYLLKETVWLLFPSCSDTLIAEWHLATHRCVQFVVSLGKPHGSMHGGQSFLWQWCRFGWWHFDGFLKKLLINRKYSIVVLSNLPAWFFAENTCYSFSTARNNIKCFAATTINLWLLLTWKTGSFMANRLTFMFTARQWLAAYFLARWTVFIATLKIIRKSVMWKIYISNVNILGISTYFSITGMFTASSNLFAFSITYEILRARNFFLAKFTTTFLLNCN